MNILRDITHFIGVLIIGIIASIYIVIRNTIFAITNKIRKSFNL